MAAVLVNIKRIWMFTPDAEVVEQWMKQTNNATITTSLYSTRAPAKGGVSSCDLKYKLRAYNNKPKICCACEMYVCACWVLVLVVVVVVDGEKFAIGTQM